MKIIGIDASLTGTGIAALRNNDLSTTAIKTDLNGVKRLIYIRDYIRQALAGADLVVIEGYSFGSVNKAHQIGELGGILRVMFEEMRIKWIEVAPTAVKKFATGKGNAKKEEIAVAVYKKWGKEFKTNDEADAAVLAYIGQAYLARKGLDKLDFMASLTAYQDEVINVLVDGKISKRKIGEKTSKQVTGKDVAK